MRYVIILVLGLILGAGGAVFFLGTSRARSMPGAQMQSPQGSVDSGTVIVTLSTGFVEKFLATVFQDLGAPSFQLGAVNPGAGSGGVEQISFQQGCTNTITLAPEGSSVKTQVQFTNGKISAPLAFSGSYNLLGNCMNFKGWAQTSVEMRFDEASQTVYGQVNVEGVDLEGVNPMANNFVTVFVRNAIDQRVNPLELIRATQLQLLIPVKASNGTVKARVKDVRAEMLDGSLKMHISYEFSGTRGEQPQG
jgi:hypothetical protein